MRFINRALLSWLLACGWMLGMASWNLGFSFQAAELSDEETQQVQATERFLKVLEKSPRRGTALDRVYGHHVEFGTLDAFLQQLKERVQKNANDGAAWMLLGMIESQRGADASAADAFKKAQETRLEDPLAAYYLGQSLLRIGQSTEAIAAFEQALSRKPARADLLEIFQQLGRVHQRAQRTDEALKVWQRLESLFPDDPRVLEQIAVTLAEEGGYALALPRYESLAKLVKDDYRRVLYRVEAAGLKIKTNERDAGIADMEGIFTDLNPDSWLYRDIRRRIEEVFLKSGDQDNLVKYYQAWLTAHPQDVDSMARLAKFLASSARLPEAKEWLEKALKLAPTRTDLRKTFIDQLVDDQRISEAIQQYEPLLAAAPGNPDFLRDWGKLVLKDKSQVIATRQQEATRIWKQIVAIRPNDASNLAQVADFFRQSNINDEAIALYQKAVDIAPNEPQYREYLGEFLHIQKRPDEAFKMWNSIAEGSRRNASNVTRLAEVLNSFGFHDQAVVEIAEACRMDPKDFSLQIRSADYHLRANKFDEALAFVSAAEKLAANDDEHDMVVKQRIEIFQSSQRLDDEIAKLESANRANANTTAEAWHLLARYQDADRRWSLASEAIDAAMKLDAKSIPILTTAAKIAEASGDFGRAADFNRKLAAVDRRSLGDHLMNVARLEAQLGRSDEAIKAAQDLIVSAPGNTDNYEFMAQMCFRMGKQAEGLDALRKAVRINPNEPHLIMALGAALADQLRTDEAIEVYWRAFEKSEDIDDKTSLTMKLVPLYQQINQFEKLIERFERDRREEEKRREMTVCLAQAHNTAGDFGTARQELESLLSQDTRDTNLLQQLSKLCESSGELEAAVAYQRQLVAIAPGPETEFPLAKMLQARGDRDEASEILVRLTRREEDPVRLLKSIDSLLTNSNMEAVISITEPLLSQQRDDWELLYREGVAWSSLGKTEEAKNRFQRILAIKIPHESLGVSAADRLKQAQSKARSDNKLGNATPIPTRQSPFEMIRMISQVQRATGLSNDSYYSSSSGPRAVWTPEAFGVARMAAYGWILRFEDDATSTSLSDSSEPKEKRNESLFDQLAAQASNENASRETIYDWLYVATLKSKNDDVFNVARRLAKTGGKEEQQYFLSSLQLRGLNVDQRSAAASGEVAQKKTPLADEDLELMMRCYEALSSNAASDTTAALASGQIAYSSSGQMFINIGGSFVPVAGGDAGRGTFLGLISDELRLAGKDNEADDLLNGYVSKAKSAAELGGAISLFLNKDKLDQLPDLYARWIDQAKQEIAKPATNVPTRSTRNPSSVRQGNVALTSHTLMSWMGKLAPNQEHARILSILDPALDVAIDESQRRRENRAIQTQRPTASTRTSSSSRTYYQWYYGKENQSTTIDFPTANEYVDMTMLSLLREVYEVFNRNDVLSDLPAHLRQRVANAKDDDQLYEKLILATILWWTEEQDEAAEWMTAAAESLKDDVPFRFEMAAMREKRGEFEEALEIVDSIVPRDQQLLQRKELMALQYAERLGDSDRAIEAADRLFGLRLDTNTQLDLAQRMRRLGLHDKADAIVTRVERKSGSQTSSLTSLMMLYQGQGKATEAIQIAQYLAADEIAQFLDGERTQNPFRYRTQQDGTRTQALQVLQQSGELKRLVEQIESQIARSPDSLRLYEDLIEYYTTLGDRVKAGEVLARAVAIKPDSVILRYQWAKHLESTNKTSEACDQYLELIKQKPEWVSDDLSSVRNLFQRAKRTSDLVDAIRTIKLKSLRQPYYIVDMVSNLLQEDKNTDVAIELFERVFEAFPNYRESMITRMQDPKLWNNDRIYQLGKRAVIPTEADVQTRPWFGIHRIYSRSSDGTGTGMFGQLLQGVATTPKRADLSKSIATTLEKYPAWVGGKAMLSLIDLKSNKKDKALESLASMLDDETTLKGMPSDACWIIGQELDKFQETKPLALKMYERALSTTNENSSQQLQYSPLVRLIKLYSESGRKDEARDMMLKALKTKAFDQFDAQYATYQRIENSFWAANKLVELGFPVDSIRLFQEIKSSPEKHQQAASWNGRPANYYADQSNAGLTKAIAALDSSNADAAVAQLLSDPEKLAAGSAVLDLLVNLPTVSNDATMTTAMESGLIKLFTSISKSKDIADSIDHRLVALRSKHLADLSIRILLAMMRLKSESEHSDDALNDLAKVIDEYPLESIPEGKRPNSRQRREAALAVPLWFVARECLANKDQHSIGEKLAAHAAAAARRQLGTKHSTAVLFDWAKLLVKQGDRANAEAKLTELLKLATERPERKPNAVRPKTGMVPAQQEIARQRLVFQLERRAVAPPKQPAASEAVPPLTMSQFNLAIAIASMAADHQMPELSRKAVQDSLVGGTPVADASTSAVDRSATLVLAMPSGFSTTTRSSMASTDSSGMESDVARKLQTVITKWAEDSYPPEEVYNLLKPMVFPPSRPTEIVLYADSSKLLEAKASSLADSLIAWSKAADRLNEVSAELEKRAKVPTSKVAATAMQVLIAIATDDNDKAQTLLADLAEQSSKAMAPVMLQQASHAALRAAEIPSLQKSAYAILKKYLDQQTQSASATTSTSSSSSTPQTLSPLAKKVNRHFADGADVASVQKYFESLLASRQSYYARYSGDSGLYKQAQDLALYANEAAQLGLPTIALDMMGRASDFRSDRYTRISLKKPMAAVCSQLATKPAEERYRIWRDWTMPTENRKTIRLFSDSFRASDIPKPFLDSSRKVDISLDADFLCNLTELTSAARAAGKLDELRNAAESAAKEKLPNAEYLVPLVLIELDDAQAGEPLIAKLVADFTERKKPQPGGKSTTTSSIPDYVPDYILYRACMRNPRFASIYTRATKSVRVATDDLRFPSTVTQTVVDYAHRLIEDHNATIRPGDDPALEHWFAASFVTEPLAAGNPWWVAHEGQIAHLAGVGSDLLYFKYPLQGDFEFSADCYHGPNANGDIGYGGFVYQASSSNILSLSNGDNPDRRASLPKRAPSSFNRVAVQSKGDRQRLLVNGHEIHSEPHSQTSPWLTLLATSTSLTSFRNVAITGSPSIPREVALLSSDSMDGWNCSFFGEVQRRPRLMAIAASDENNPNYYEQRREPTSFDWSTQDGILEGKKNANPQESGQSWIYYHRPLQSNETFRYEFFYIPEQSIANPTIGRVAMILAPHGIRTHWIAKANWDDELYGVSPDNARDEKECRRGPAVLPLKDRDWNRVELTLKDNVAVVALNGVVVFERPCETQLDHRFGLFRYKNQASKVRRAALTGDWPAEWKTTHAQNLLAMKTERSPADRRVVHSLISDRFFEADVDEVVIKARAMSPDQGYAFLKNWTIPSDDHIGFRLYFAFVSDPSAAVSDKRESQQSLLSPAIELVRMAAELKRLPELQQEVSRYESNDPIEVRNRNAMLALIALQHSDAETTRAAIAECYKPIVESLSKDLELRDRAAEFLVVWQTAQRSEFRNLASDLSVSLTKMERAKETNSGGVEWKTQLGILAGHVAAWNQRALTKTAQSSEPLTQWHRVPYFKPDHRFDGYQSSTWTYSRGVTQHLPGGTWQQLYFQSPLRGKFEILGERSMYESRDLSIGYGHHAVDINKQRPSIRITKVMHNTQEIDLKADVSTFGDLHGFRIVVDDTKVSNYINGVLIHEQTFDQPLDPWIVLQASKAYFPGMIHDLRIIGSPEIPRELNLIDMAGWAGWRADVYGEAHSNEVSTSINPNQRARPVGQVLDKDLPWQHVGDEMIGILRKDRGLSPSESLIMYQRPILEDGQIEWDAFYTPGEIEVHPAIGGYAFLIRSDGVRLHRLTDGVFETTELTVDNESPIDGASNSVPLKAKEWNRYKLTMKGDQLALAVNDGEVARWNVTEPPTSRFFGFFRYSNRSEARVRNVIYRGDWPKTLPPVADQQLAYPIGGPFQLTRTEGLKTFDVPVNQSLESIQKADVSIMGPMEQLSISESGLKMAVRGAKTADERPGLRFVGFEADDGEITVDYNDLQMTPARKTLSVALSITAFLDDAEKTTVECSLRKGADDKQFLFGGIRRMSVTGTFLAPDSVQATGGSSSGRLRLVRLGAAIHCLYADADSEAFRILHSIAIGNSKIPSITVEAKSSDEAGQVDVLIKSIVIKKVEQPSK